MLCIKFTQNQALIEKKQGNIKGFRSRTQQKNIPNVIHQIFKATFQSGPK